MQLMEVKNPVSSIIKKANSFYLELLETTVCLLQTLYK